MPESTADEQMDAMGPRLKGLALRDAINSMLDAAIARYPGLANLGRKSLYWEALEYFAEHGKLPRVT